MEQFRRQPNARLVLARRPDPKQETHKMLQATYMPSTSALGHNPDAELIHLVKQARATWQALSEAIPDVVDIPPETDAELRRLVRLVHAYAERAVVLPALTPAGLRAKAELVRLLHGADLAAAASCIEQRALASLCADLIADDD